MSNAVTMGTLLSPHTKYARMSTEIIFFGGLMIFLGLIFGLFSLTFSLYHTLPGVAVVGLGAWMMYIGRYRNNALEAAWIYAYGFAPEMNTMLSVEQAKLKIWRLQSLNFSEARLPELAAAYRDLMMAQQGEIARGWLAQAIALAAQDAIKEVGWFSQAEVKAQLAQAMTTPLMEQPLNMLKRLVAREDFPKMYHD